MALSYLENNKKIFYFNYTYHHLPLPKLHLLSLLETSSDCDLLEEKKTYKDIVNTS